MNRAMASSMSLSRAAMPILCAKGATWVSTKVAASWESEMVRSAIRRARHTCRSPPRMRAQVLGSRYLVSTA